MIVVIVKIMMIIIILYLFLCVNNNNSHSWYMFLKCFGVPIFFCYSLAKMCIKN